MNGWMRNKRVLAGVAAAIILATLAVTSIQRCGKDEQKELPMERTMASIEEVRPRGEIYVCTALIEDYTTLQKVEHNLFWTNEEHSCVQTLRQRCSYKVDLNRVEYETSDSTKTVFVKLPPIEYVATTQSSSFLSDDANYWAEHLPNTNEMKRKVESQIRRRFDTAENRRKAERYAEDAVSQVLSQLGYEVEFVRVLEKKKE